MCTYSQLMCCQPQLWNSSKFELSTMIINFANRSFEVRRISSSMKMGLVTPFLKKTDLDINNLKIFFRSQICQQSRKLRGWFSRNYNRILQSRQTIVGFNRHTARVSQPRLLWWKLSVTFLHHSKEGYVVAPMSLDITAAYDMVNHKTLTSRLESEFGVASTALKWISSYLQVRVGSARSTTVQSTAGVPQRS